MPSTIDKIPVLLITGYLGSGKTTLLNRILTNNKGIRFAVIVNDIGEVNIDASLIQKGGVVSQNDDSLVALQNGCICCSLKMDLIQQLHDLVSQRQGQSQQPAFDYIVIEASGICEPAPIAQTLCSYPQMVPQFAKDGLPVLDCICSVVDALRLRDEFDGGHALEHHIPKEEDLAALVIEQIEFSNIILLNKASEVSEDEFAHIKSVIRAIQPTAEIIETNYCDVDFDKILNTRLFDFDRTATSAAWIQEVEDAQHHHDHDDDDDDDEHEEHEHHHHHHDHDHEHGDHDHLAEFGIDTYVYYARRPFDLGMFDEFVAAHWPKNVIRCKGMCYFAEEYDMCYLFEQA
ncbi:MAG: GTP-binding protein, partial [Paludibacteraceae bacterium]|nr:GTP-binding protein [Paludibacteraceae bacterium]